MKSLIALFLAVLIGGVLLLGTNFYYFNPSSAPWYGFTGVYAGIFLLTFSISGYLGLLLRNIFGLKSTKFSKKSLLRQAVLIGLAVTAAAFFQALRILNPITIILLTLSMGILELYFSSRNL